MARKFQRVAYEVAAIQVTPQALKDGRLQNFLGYMWNYAAVQEGRFGLMVWIPTDRGGVSAHENDWLTKEIDGEFYAMSPKLFGLAVERKEADQDDEERDGELRQISVSGGPG